MAAKNRRMLTFDALVAEFAAVRAEGGGEMSKTETCADSTPTPEEKRRGENAVLLEPLKRALRHISHFADTLSPQEVINVCAGALGVDRHDYAGECDPNRSLVELHVERELWRTEHLLNAAVAEAVEAYRDRMRENRPGLNDAWEVTCQAIDARRAVLAPKPRYIANNTVCSIYDRKNSTHLTPEQVAALLNAQEKS